MSWPGRNFASVISSFTVLTGTGGWTTSRFGPVAASVTGAKSFSGSYGSFATSDGWMAIAAMCAIMIV